MSKELAVRDELADMLKGGGIALAACTIYQTIRNHGEEIFSNETRAAISAYTVFNEILFLWFFNRIFRKAKFLTKTLRRQLLARLVIFGAIIYYSMPLFVGPDIQKWIYASIFAIKLTVSTPFLIALKWNSLEEATGFLNFTLAVAYGVMTYQSFQM